MPFIVFLFSSEAGSVIVLDEKGHVQRAGLETRRNPAEIPPVLSVPEAESRYGTQPAASPGRALLCGYGYDWACADHMTPDHCR